MTIFHYCPNCITNLRQTTSRLINCDHCGFKFYFSPTATNAVIINNIKKEILLVKRKYPPNVGFWDFPGGFLEYGESAEESVRREIKEELRIEFSNFHYFSSYPDRYLFKGINYHTINLVYVAGIKNLKLSVADDITAYRFFPANKIPYSKLAFPYMKISLNDYFLLINR